MKKSIPTKLTVRHETLRALAGIELTRAAGGDGTLPRESGAAMCPAPVVIAPKPLD
jgi:hypothetical protein